MEKVLCLYHRDCIDGHAAAWVVGYACGFENVEFVAIGYESELPDFKGREVYCVDIAPRPTPEFMRNVSCAKKVVILDHHETSWTNWESFKMGEPHVYRYKPLCSGVGVTWQWFYGSLTKMPYALQLVQDRDLFNFSLVGTREFHEVAISQGILSAPPAEESWFGRMVKYEVSQAHDFSDLMPEIHTEGQAILRAQKVMLQTLLKRARVVNIAGHDVPLCNIPYDLRSEAGFWLSQKYPFSVTYDDNWATGERRYSIRSNKKTGIDVQPIAAFYGGGGGHKHAAGWTTSVDTEIPWTCASAKQLQLDLEIE
jgi:uncharacterized protein